MSSTPAAPPIVPGELEIGPRPPVWPTAIGTISIVLGALGLIQGCFGAFTPLIVNAVSQAVPQNNPQAAAQINEATAAMRQWGPWIVALSVVSALCAGLLLAAGIGLVGRRRWAVTWVRVWAVAKIIIAVGSAVVQYQFQQTQFQAMQNQPGMPQIFGCLTGATAVGAFIQLLWLWAFPVFVLVWFGRAAIRAGIASWR